jgi:hypothetical protein
MDIHFKVLIHMQVAQEAGLAEADAFQLVLNLSSLVA